MFYVVSCDVDGIIRLLDYDPDGTEIACQLVRALILLSSDHESKSGQHLLRRTEFHAQVESQTSALVARRLEEDGGVPQSRLISGMSDCCRTCIVI